MVPHVQRRAKRILGATVTMFALISIPISAQAWGVSIAGAYSGNYNTGYGAGTGVAVFDTAADAHRAQLNFKRYSSANPTVSISANGNGKMAYNETYGRVVLQQVCTLNLNPFDSQNCSGWYSG